MTIERALAEAPPCLNAFGVSGMNDDFRTESFRSFDNEVSANFQRLREASVAHDGLRGARGPKHAGWTAPQSHPEPRLPAPVSTAERNFHSFICSLVRVADPALSLEQADKIAGMIFAWEYARVQPTWTTACDVGGWRAVAIPLLDGLAIARPELFENQQRTIPNDSTHGIPHRHFGPHHEAPRRP